MIDNHTCNLEPLVASCWRSASRSMYWASEASRGGSSDVTRWRSTLTVSTMSEFNHWNVTKNYHDNIIAVFSIIKQAKYIYIYTMIPLSIISLTESYYYTFWLWIVIDYKGHLKIPVCDKQQRTHGPSGQECSCLALAPAVYLQYSRLQPPHHLWQQRRQLPVVIVSCWCCTHRQVVKQRNLHQLSLKTNLKA